MSTRDVGPHIHEPVDIVPQGTGSGLDADKVDGIDLPNLPISTLFQTELDRKPTGTWSYDGTTFIVRTTA